MRRFPTVAARLMVLAAPAWLILAVAAPSQAGTATSNPVRTFTTGNHSELVKTIPISRKKDAKAKVVMRLASDRVGAFRAGDRLLTSAEVEVTTCLKAPPHTSFEDACVGKPYPYDPHVSAKVILGDKRDSTRGRLVGAPRDLECSQHQPNRNHHCVLVLPWRSYRVERDCTGCHLNLVMTSWRHDVARDGNQLVIGAHEKDEPIEQDKGRLNLVRFRPGDTPAVDPRAGSKVNVRVPIANEGNSPTDVIARSLHLSGLHRGDEIYVDARTRSGIGGLPYNVLIKGEVYTARSRHAFHGGGTDRYTAPNPEISELNGFNCTQGRSAHHNPCTRPKVGVVRISDDVDDLWINMSLNAQAKPNESNQNSWDRGDRMKVRSSHLRVWVNRGA